MSSSSRYVPPFPIINQAKCQPDKLDHRQQRAMIEAIAIAKRLAFCRRSIEIICAALAVMCGWDPEHLYAECVRTIDRNPLTFVLDGACVVDVYIWNSHPDVVYVKHQYVKLCGFALLHNLNSTYHGHLFILSVIIANGIVHSLMRILITQKTRLADNQTDVEECRTLGYDLNGYGFSWESEFLGGTLCWINAQVACRYPGQLDFPVVKRDWTSGVEDYFIISPSKFMPFTTDHLGWEHLLPLAFVPSEMCRDVRFLQYRGSIDRPQRRPLGELSSNVNVNVNFGSLGGLPW